MKLLLSLIFLIVAVNVASSASLFSEENEEEDQYDHVISDEIDLSHEFPDHFKSSSKREVQDIDKLNKITEVENMEEAFEEQHGSFEIKSINDENEFDEFTS